MSIRQKFVLILLVMAGIPLLIALLSIGLVGKRYVEHDHAQLLEAIATSITGSLRFSINEQVDDVATWAEFDNLRASLGRETRIFADSNHPFARLAPEQIETQWPVLQPGDPSLDFFLGNPTAGQIKEFLRVHPAFVEILITDAHGGIMAASNKSSDYWQADEDWWQKGVRLPPRTVWLEGIHFDKSAGIYSLDIITAIRSKDPTAAPLGVIKGVLDVTPLIQSVGSILSRPGQQTFAVLPDGEVLLRIGVDAPPDSLTRYPPPATRTVFAAPSGTFIGDVVSGAKAFAGFSQLEFAGHTRQSTRIASESRIAIVETSLYSEVMGPVTGQLRKLMGSGLVVIAGLLLVADRLLARTIIRPLQILHRLTGRLTRSPTGSSADSAFHDRIMEDIRTDARQIDSADEIEDLSKAFVSMSARIVDNEQTLLTIQRDLEETVEHRTRDLVEANRQLTDNQAQLEQLVGQLQVKNDDLQSFAYVVSHDLKAPLRGIGTLADWLSSEHADQLNEEGKQLLATLQQRVARQDQLIDGILKYSRAGSDTGTEPVAVGSLLTTVIDSLHAPSHVRVTCHPPFPTLSANRAAMHQIFQNLLSNAIKYMDKPEGHVDVSCREIETGWEFCVRDNGPGIEEKYHDRIFKLFQTLAPRDHVEGSGIGLSVVKRQIEAAGGTIRLESTLGEGAAFFFTWPNEIPAPAAP